MRARTDSFKPSEQQLLIFDWFENGEGENAIVQARAGTGKSTTMVQGVKYAPERDIIMLAFAKKNKLDLEEKLKHVEHAIASTSHSASFEFVRRNWPRVNIDRDRGFRLAQLATGEENPPNPIVKVIDKLASLIKNVMPLVHPVNSVIDLAHQFDCLPPGEWERDYHVRDIAELAIKAVSLASRRDGTINFDDMIYLPVKHDWIVGTYDLVIIDEAQDQNTCQMHIAKKLVTPGGRICAVGDDRQAIYAFRGADTESMAKLKAELKAKEFKLTTTYRCGKKIVERARVLVPDYVAAPQAPEGEIVHLGEEQMQEQAKAGDFILSRKNAPLMKHCLRLLKRGVRAKIEGREVGKGIETLVRKQKASSIGMLMEKLELWLRKEVARAQENPKTVQDRVDAVTDQHDLISSLAEECDSVDELLQRIETLFTDAESDNSSRVILSSVHRAKGLEADRVFLLQETFYPGGRVNQEEKNIEYVAITRAKKWLAWVTPLPPPPKPITALVLVSDWQRWQTIARQAFADAIYNAQFNRLQRGETVERLRVRFRREAFRMSCQWKWGGA